MTKWLCRRIAYFCKYILEYLQINSATYSYVSPKNNMPVAAIIPCFNQENYSHYTPQSVVTEDFSKVMNVVYEEKREYNITEV